MKTSDLTENVGCVICNNSDLKKLKTFLVKNQKLALVKCKKCGLIFFSPRLNESETSRLYKEDLLNQSEHNSKYLQEDQEDFFKRLMIIKKYSKNKGSVLDIGCSVGTFLHCCERFGFKEIYGTDLNEKTNKVCQNKYNYPVGPNLPNKRFDLINLSDVIEHLYNPKEFLLKIRNNLDDGGIIVITTPNINNPINKIVNIKPEEHQYYFNKKTLSKLLNQCGYKVIHQRLWNRYHSLKNLINTSTAKKLKPILKLIILLRLDFLFNNLVLKNLYTDIFLIAKIDRNKINI